MEYKSLRKFISVQVELIAIIKDYTVDDKKLRSKERDFFVECVILNAQGKDLDSPETLDYLRDFFEFKSTDNVYTYRSVIKGKKWFYKDNRGRFKIVSAFDWRNRPMPISKTYKFDIKYNEALEKVQRLSTEEETTTEQNEQG